MRHYAGFLQIGSHIMLCMCATLLLFLRYINVFLKKVAQGGMIIYSPSRKAFYSRKQGTQTMNFKAENYTDITGE